MSELQPLMRDQRKVDAEHLKLLSVFHFVGAGLALLGLIFILIYYVFFHALLVNPHVWDLQNQAPPPLEFFAIFRWIFLILGVWFLISGILNLLSGLYIRARNHRVFSIVVAAFNCLHTPLGTVLGIFTIIVLLRDSVRELYDAESYT